MSPIEVETEVLMDARLSPVARLIWILLPKTLNSNNATTFSCIAESVGCSEIESEDAFYDLVNHGYVTRCYMCQNGELIVSSYEIEYLTIEKKLIPIEFKIL